MAQGTLYDRSADPASVDAHAGCEARVQFLARQLAECLEIAASLRQQRDEVLAVLERMAVTL